MTEKQRWAIRRGVPLTRVQWIVFAAAGSVGIIGMVVLIVVGKINWAGIVGGLAALTMVSVVLAATGARNDRIARGSKE